MREARRDATRGAVRATERAERYGYLMAVDDTLGAVSAGAVRCVQKDRDHLRFASAGTRLALVFRQA